MAKFYRITSDSAIGQIIAEMEASPELPKQVTMSIIYPIKGTDATKQEAIKDFKANKLLPFMRHLPKLNIVNLSLANLFLKPEEIKPIFPNEENHFLQELDLSVNCLEDEGVNFLVDRLRKFIVLETLNIDYNNIGPKGAEHLAKFLKYTATLKTLHLGIELILDENNPLRNKIGDEGLGHIIQALETNTSLQTLYCSANEVSFELIGLSGVAKNESIKTLFLGGNKINSHGMFNLCTALQNHPKIELLNLNNNPLTDAGVEAVVQVLKNNKSLIFLNTNSIGMTDKGLSSIIQALPGCPNLKGFNIGGEKTTSNEKGNEISPTAINAFIQSLVSRTNVEYFGIPDTKLDNQAVSSLIILLKNNPIQHLLLSNTGITTEHYKKIFNEIKHKGLQLLDISGNDLGKDLLSDILQKLGNNNSLFALVITDSFGEIPTYLDKVEKALKANKSLTIVRVDDKGASLETTNKVNETIQIYTERNKNYANKLAKFIHLNKELLCTNNELSVPEELLKYENCTNFPNPKIPINFFNLFFSVSKHILTERLIELEGVSYSEISNNTTLSLIHTFHKHIAVNFFHIAGICKEFQEGCVFSTLPTEVLEHLIIGCDIKLSHLLGDKFAIPLDDEIICSGDIGDNGVDLV